MKITVNKTSGVYNVGQRIETAKLNVVRGDKEQLYKYDNGRVEVVSTLQDLRNFAGNNSEYTKLFMSAFHMNWATYRMLHKEQYADYATKVVAVRNGKSLTQKAIDKSKCVSLQMSTTGCRESKNTILENHSGYVCIDLDHFKSQKEFYNVFFTLNKLKGNLSRYLYSWDMSFSGDGFHMIIYIGTDVANEDNDYTLYKSRFEWVYGQIRTAFDVNFDELVDLHFYNEPEQQVKMGCNLMHFNDKFSEKDCDALFLAYEDDIRNYTYYLFDKDRKANRFTIAKYAVDQDCTYTNSTAHVIENTNKKMIWNYNNRAGLRSALHLLKVPNIVETYVSICKQNPNLQAGETVAEKISEYREEMETYKPTGNEYISQKMKAELKNYGIEWTEQLDEVQVEELNAEKIIQLEPNDYVGNHIDEIFTFCKTGVYQLISPTGSGKNQWLIGLLEDNLIHHRMLISEPFTSIVESKYDAEIVDKLIRNHHYNDNTKVNGKAVVNYCHLLEIPAKEIINNFDYLIVDESHLIVSEMYRAAELIRVIELIKTVSKSIPVILQTATPYIEHELFDIKGTIRFEKKLQKHITYDILLHDGTHGMYDLYDAIKKDIEDGKKVYVYKSTMSKNEAVKFKTDLDLRTAVYHKRCEHEDNIAYEDMQYINENHCLGDKYDVLLSSVYFSVGNDINDDCAWSVYILDWYTAQEDNQVVGRLRNATEIHVHAVLSYAMIDKLVYEAINLDKLIEHRYNQFCNMYNDMQNRNKSVIIGSAAYNLSEITPSNLHTLAQMSIVDDKCSVYNYKMKYLEQLGYEVDSTPILNGERLEFEDEETIQLDSVDYIERLLHIHREMHNKEKADIIRDALSNGWKSLDYMKDNETESNNASPLNKLIAQIQWCGNHLSEEQLKTILTDNKVLPILGTVDFAKEILYHYAKGCDVSEIKSLMVYRSAKHAYENMGKLDELFASCFAFFIKNINKDANMQKMDWQPYIKKYKDIAEKFANLHQDIYDCILHELAKVHDWDEQKDLFEWLKENQDKVIYIPNDEEIKRNSAIHKGVDLEIYYYVLSYMHNEVKPNKKHKQKKVTYDGVVYENREEAMKILGKSKSWVEKNCKTLK